MNEIEKFSLFVLMLLGTTTFGISSSLFGLSLIQFSENMHVSIEKIVDGLSVSFFFGSIGSLAAVFCLDRWNRQIQLGLYFILFGVTSIVFPLSTSYLLYLFMSALHGLLLPFLMTIPSVWIIELFGETSKIYLQVSHFFFSFGQLLGPIITTPFLNDNYHLKINYHNNDLNTTKLLTLYTAGDTEILLNSHINVMAPAYLFVATHLSDLWIPYLITVILKLICGSLIITAYLIKPYEKPKKELSSKDNRTLEFNIFEDAKKNLSKIYTVIFTGLICLITGTILVNEANAITFFPTYLAESDLRLDIKTVGHCQEILTLSIIFGRFTNIFLTYIFRIKIQSMLFINFISIILGNLFIMTIGTYSLTGVYIGSILLGYGFSNALPMIIALVEERVTLNNKKMALMNFSSTLFMCISSFKLGGFLESNPSNYILLNLGINLFAFFLYLVLFILEHLRLSKKFN